MSTYAGTIPALYDRHLGPVLFEPYAEVTLARLPRDAARVLEVAAGTGRLTRRIAAELPCELVATDLQQAMLDEARRHVASSRVTWQVADAQALPFGDASFDAVVCQFGLMFPPDRALAVREMKRVLRKGGTLVLLTWDSLETNPASLLLHELALAAFPDDPPTFMAMPFSLHDPAELRSLAGGAVETVRLTGEAVSAEDLAIGFVRGNPLATQLAERGIDAVAFEARVAAALGDRFGDRPCRVPLSAQVLVARA